MAEILVVEDMANPRKAMSVLLQREGYAVDEAADGQLALQKLSDHFYDLMITDYKMEPMDGFELLQHSRRTFPLTKVILLTAFGSIKQSVVAMKLGAYDYLTKPCEPKSLLQVVKTALIHPPTDISDSPNLRAFKEIIGDSDAMQQVLWLVSQIAETECTVLIQGESGTGKEMIAKAIHERSHRRSHPLVAVNCGALPENLLESELFGHVRGSFTGAIKDRKGLFQEAEGGTLFLDEIGDISPALQVKLLRVLQEGEIRRIGDNQSTKVDVRILAATNKDLEQEVVCGRFREDLFYRLNVIPIQVPALRNRKDDIPDLVNHFTLQYAERMKKSQLDWSVDALRRLQEYNWPGNVRELENFIERLTAISQKAQIQEADVISHLSRSTKPLNAYPLTGEVTLSELEKRAILDAMHRYQNNHRLVSDKLGISTTTLWRKLKEYNIS
jgi:two-component system response regulator HydG